VLRAQFRLAGRGHRGNLASVVENAHIRFGGVSLRPLQMRDVRPLRKLLLKDRDWLRPWEATTPGIRYPLDVRQLVKALISQSKKEIGLAWVVLVDDEIAGQLNVANILHGSVGSATMGYWISRDFAGRNAIPIACALGIDYLFEQVGLHRVEIDIRPENAASLRVVEKLGMRREGLKERFIHIDGAWRDHLIFAITKEELAGSMLGRLSNTLKQ